MSKPGEILCIGFGSLPFVHVFLNRLIGSNPGRDPFRVAHQMVRFGHICFVTCHTIRDTVEIAYSSSIPHVAMPPPMVAPDATVQRRTLPA